MTKHIKIFLAFGIILTLGACSSSKTTQTSEGVDPALADGALPPDAGTDAVPQANAELPPAEPDTGQVAVDDPATTPPADPAMAEAAPDAATPPAADPATQPPAEQTAYATPPSPAGSGQYEDFTVQSGDTLMKLAFETYGDLYRWKSILDANKDKITDPNAIPAGTVLKIERPATHVAIERNGEKYLIKNGDTLGTISNEVYGTRTKWKVLWENNKQLIHDPNRIFAGFYLYYQPDASSPPAESPTLNQQPMANSGGSAPAPGATLAVPNPGDATATTAGDTTRAPASADAPPAAADPAADQTATQ